MKFDIIYADPPWNFQAYSDKGHSRSPQNHYSTMNLEDICNLNVGSIASKHCVLFLWVTFPHLLQGLKVIERWGFQYKTLGFCWVKKNRKSDTWFWGLGYWTRSNPELCLIATRGNPKRVSRSVFSVVATPIERHSKKPDVVRDRIVALMGDIPRIELFARQSASGWVSVGNEIDGLSIEESIAKYAEKEDAHA